MPLHLLEGEVEDPRDARIRALEDEIAGLTDALAQAEAQAEVAKRDAARALSSLRRQLSPLYRALQAVFGELDRVGPSDEGEAVAGDPRHAAIWKAWQEKMPGYPARIIAALLLHREMNTSQLAIAVGCHKQRISEGIVKLNKAGLINKNAGRFSLKAL